MRFTRIKRSRKGQSLIEVAIGGILLIPMALCIMDLCVLANTNSINDAAAKNAARAAANQQDSAHATAAATQALQAFKPSGITTISMDWSHFSYTTDQVTVRTKIDVKLPFPFPGFNEQVLVAQSTEPNIAFTQ